MTTSFRPYVTSGIAIVGASVLLVSPMGAAPSPQLHAPHVAVAAPSTRLVHIPRILLLASVGGGTGSGTTGGGGGTTTTGGGGTGTSPFPPPPDPGGAGLLEAIGNGVATTVSGLTDIAANVFNNGVNALENLEPSQQNLATVATVAAITVVGVVALPLVGTGAAVTIGATIILDVGAAAVLGTLTPAGTNTGAASTPIGALVGVLASLPSALDAVANTTTDDIANAIGADLTDDADRASLIAGEIRGLFEAIAAPLNAYTVTAIVNAEGILMGIFRQVANTLSLSANPAATPLVTPAVTPKVTAALTPAVTPAVTPVVTPAVTAAVTPAVTPTVTPKITLAVTPKVTTPAVTPTVTATVTPAVTPTVTPAVTTTVTPKVTPAVKPTHTLHNVIGSVFKAVHTHTGTTQLVSTGHHGK
jgi:hypothetical protein